jgi:hypothetical protein
LATVILNAPALAVWSALIGPDGNRRFLLVDPNEKDWNKAWEKQKKLWDAARRIDLSVMSTPRGMAKHASYPASRPSDTPAAAVGPVFGCGIDLSSGWIASLVKQMRS